MTLRAGIMCLASPVMIAAASNLLIACSALAQENAAQPIPASIPPTLPLWEAGLFGLGIRQPDYPGTEYNANRLLVLPYIIYRGQYLRADRGSVGVRALKNQRIEMDVGFAASLGSHSSDIPARQGMPDLGTMIEFGPRLKVNLGDVSSGRSSSRLQFPLREVIDVSHGFVSRGIAFEPQWVNDIRPSNRWLISTNLGAIFGDEKLCATYYEVAPDQATPTRPSYMAKSGLIALRAGLFVAQSLTSDVRIFYILRIESLEGAANRDSSLVQRNFGWSAGIGLSWALKHSEQSSME